jgi:hypothetical protein
MEDGIARGAEAGEEACCRGCRDLWANEWVPTAREVVLLDVDDHEATGHEPNYITRVSLPRALECSRRSGMQLAYAAHELGALLDRG